MSRDALPPDTPNCKSLGLSEPPPFRTPFTKPQIASGCRYLVVLEIETDVSSPADVRCWVTLIFVDVQLFESQYSAGSVITDTDPTHRVTVCAPASSGPTQPAPTASSAPVTMIAGYLRT